MVLRDHLSAFLSGWRLGALRAGPGFAVCDQIPGNIGTQITDPLAVFHIGDSFMAKAVVGERAHGEVPHRVGQLVGRHDGRHLGQINPRVDVGETVG
jgi:hypothetical protein